MLDPSSSVLERARHLLRAHHTATLLADGDASETRLLLDPKSGDFVFEWSKDAEDASDTTLALPRDSFDCPVRISIEIVGDAGEEQRDRFTAYHLPATEPNLAAAHVSFVKIDSGDVFEPRELELVNPLVARMGALCRVCNEDRERLRTLCRVCLGSGVEDALAVGVDDTGIDVRAHGGLVRVPLPTRVEDHDEALRTITAMLEAADA